ncbi:hypothetical protein J6590_033925 [Homalodisca vitripennis]|nr:hypothetical protein J6590_033925 [Homalodisca vitripennis]
MDLDRRSLLPTLPIHHILSLQKQRTGPFRTRCNFEASCPREQKVYIGSNSDPKLDVLGLSATGPPIHSTWQRATIATAPWRWIRKALLLTTAISTETPPPRPTCRHPRTPCPTVESPTPP